MRSGATVSTVTASAVEAALVLPAASVALAVKAWVPLANVAVVKVQAPVAFAVAVPIWAGAVEDLDGAVGRGRAGQRQHVGVGDAVADDIAVRRERQIAGAVGATVSTVTPAPRGRAGIAGGIRGVAVKAWVPSASVAVVKLQAPAASAVAVPIWLAPSKILTVALATGRASQSQLVGIGDTVAGDVAVGEKR